MITVACVLRSGGPYQVRDVLRLQQAVRRHLAEPHQFVCLTDCAAIPGVSCIALQQGWPGWWSKMELFSRETFGQDEPVLYFDLDTIILGDISALAALAANGPPERFLVLRDFYRSTHYGSGVMAFRGGQHFRLFQRFSSAAADHIRRTGPTWGDQQIIEMFVTDALLWQDHLPPLTIASYKVHLMGQHNAPPPETRVVCFHGVPRPWDVDLPWVKAYWI